MTEEEHDAKLRAEAQALREEVAEYEALCNRQAELLSQSIVAIRGPEPELTRWGYADLPLRVKTIVEEVAALRARVVVPDGFALVPIEPNDEMLSAGCVADNAMHSNLSNRDNKHRCYQSMLNAAPRLNGKAVSEGLLRRLARPAHRYDEVFTVDRHEAAEELRALLGGQE
ncbi:hypothetical protein ACQGZL_004430 [Pseudomonas aeruginosa]|uniref:hypothetical protein n=1 Tax=Pseudomonas aeruginosa TaxID=287 RepID=UPI00163BB0DC|nr:hypothetical protein [Pseudomonas aeruginosa]EMA4286619.1 hypothetical protein [Pseudomonas aeruginosa]